MTVADSGGHFGPLKWRPSDKNASFLVPIEVEAEIERC